MKFDVQKAVGYVLDEQNSPQLRAIELFALLVALHVGRSRVKVSSRNGSRPQNESNLALDVSERRLRAAKMLAALKMLDQLETDWIAENGGQEPTMERMAKLEGYKDVFNQIILKNGSWNRIRLAEHSRFGRQTLGTAPPSASHCSNH
jgi:hypothetical protein